MFQSRNQLHIHTFVTINVLVTVLLSFIVCSISSVAVSEIVKNSGNLTQRKVIIKAEKPEDFGVLSGVWHWKRLTQFHTQFKENRFWKSNAILKPGVLFGTTIIYSCR